MKKGYETSKKAKELAQNATALERALVEAIQARFPTADPAKDYISVNQDYAAAMEPVYESFGRDLDVATLYAGALMNITPWALWDLFTGKPVRGAPTMKVKSVLECALAQDQNGSY